MNFKWTLDDVLCTDRYLEAFPNNYFRNDIFYNYPQIGWRGNQKSRPLFTQRLIVSGHSDYPIIEDNEVNFINIEKGYFTHRIFDDFYNNLISADLSIE